MGWLWAAYKAGSFALSPDLTQEAFAETIRIGTAHQKNYLVEDRNPNFASGAGPVALVGMVTDGFHAEPAVAIFKWATKRNVLRGFVAFFQWIKHNSEIGVCEVKVPSKDSRILRKMGEYGVLFPKETHIVFRISGRKKRDS